MSTVLFRAFALLLTCLACHVLIWRIWRVRKQAVWLSVIFLIAPTICSAIYLLLPFAASLGQLERVRLTLTLILHYAISVSYMLLYTGITDFSPSIAVLQRVASSMPNGLKREELAPEWFTDERLSGTRHRNLKNLGLISESAGVLHIERRGRLIALPFLVFRRVLGLPALAGG